MSREKMVKADVVASYVGEDVETTRRKARNGTYPCHRSGRLVRFKLSEIDKATEGGEYAKNDGTRRRSNLATS